MNNKNNIKNRITYIYQARKGRKRYNAQMATEYILYMMLGSMFKRCIFASSAMEERIRLEYMKMPVDEQYEIEDRIIAWAETTLDLKKCEDIWCKVFTYQERGYAGICFETYFGAIEMMIDQKGNVFQPHVE